MSVIAGDRGRRGAHYTLLTPANRYASKLPGFTGASVFKLATPRLAPARFGQYLVAAGESPLSVTIEPGMEHFLFGLTGSASVTGNSGWDLTGGGFAYIGPSAGFEVTSTPGSELLWIKRHYQAFPGLRAPGVHSGRLADVEATATAVPGLARRELIDPDNPAFDFNISHMEFAPNTALAQIEIHDEEHGLYMTSGGGVYHLNGDEFDVQQEDFIYMAPYCPQGFRAGSAGASYLLYKDVYRDGF
jgi:(S)-ureidoglycine aminohydrolase